MVFVVVKLQPDYLSYPPKLDPKQEEGLQRKQE